MVLAGFASELSRNFHAVKVQLHYGGNIDVLHSFVIALVPLWLCFNVNVESTTLLEKLNLHDGTANYFSLFA